MSEKVMCGFTETKDFSWGEKITIRLKKSEIELLSSYLSTSDEKYEPSVSLELLTGKSGRLYSSINTFFYDKANGGTSGRGTGKQTTKIAEPEPTEPPF